MLLRGKVGEGGGGGYCYIWARYIYVCPAPWDVSFLRVLIFWGIIFALVRVVFASVIFRFFVL